ncbi:MAG: hydroxymethylbilane synthase [bacterium]
MKDKLIIGSRGSQLALWQSNFIKERLEETHRGLQVEIKVIKTTGDKILDAPLAKIGDKGLFVKELEEALLAESVDLAVHSMKDLPTGLPQGLIIGAVGEREDPHDVLISRSGLRLEDLARGGHIGSSSLRRQSQLLHYSDKIRFSDLRGNLNTRVARVEKGDFDATILAAAGIKRLGWEDKITQKIPFDIMLPAVGQGALGIEIREKDPDSLSLIRVLDHPLTHNALLAERALMRRLEGGCQIPIGAYCKETGAGKLEISGMVGSLDGTELLRSTLSGEPESPEELGFHLAERLLSMGAGKILQSIR